jgi:Kef-type K+ transport system membrane component KefB
LEASEVTSLLLFYLGAFIAPPVAAQVRLPASVVEILYGLAVGASGLGLVEPTAFSRFLSDLGFTFLMFLVGLEIDFNHMEREGRRSVLLATLVVVAILAGGTLIARRMDWPPFLALVLGAMSVGILLVVLREVGASQTRLGQMLLLVGSLGEFATLIALTGYDLVHTRGVGLPLVEEALKGLLLFAAAYAILSLLRLLVWWFPDRFEHWGEAQDPSEMGVRSGLVLMLSLGALAALVGLEGILGAFLAGALFSFVFREKGYLETKLGAIGQGFFVPLFFIHIGVTFDAGALADLAGAARMLGLLAAASLLTKLLPTLLLLFGGFSLRQVTAGAFLLATPLTLLVAIAAIGRRIGVLDSALVSSIILLAIVTGVIFPTLTKLLLGARPVTPPRGG